MKKLIGIVFLFFIAGGCEEVEFNPHNDTGHISGSVMYHHHDMGQIELSEHISQAVVELWYHETQENGTPDYKTVADNFGKFHFDHLKNGIYLIKASGIDSNGIMRAGSTLLEITVFEQELELDLEIE